MCSKIKIRWLVLFILSTLFLFPLLKPSAVDSTYDYEFSNINSAVLGKSSLYYKYDKNGDKKINSFDSCISKKKYFDILLNPPVTETTPPETTTPVPDPYIVPGIDVSRWQNSIDWQKVKASGVNFAIIRAGYGRLREQEDGNFRVNIQNAKNAGINCGVYWYSYADSPDDAILEAQVCLDVIRGYQLEYPVFFDIEESFQKALGKETVSNIINAFCSTVEAQGYYVGVYSNKNFLTDCISQDILNRYNIWLAQWSDQVTYAGDYGIWQYTSGGCISGIDGNVDLNISYKNYPEIMKTFHLNGY